MNINVNGPEYRGAPYPKFNKMAINEERFNDEERMKEATIELSNDGKTGYVYWEGQEISEDSEPSEAWENEIRRAFKANGAKKGCVISIEYCGRDWYNCAMSYKMKI